MTLFNVKIHNLLVQNLLSIQKLLFILLCLGSLSVQAREFKTKPIPTEVKIFLERLNLPKTKNIIMYDVNTGASLRSLNYPYADEYVKSFNEIKSNFSNVFIFKGFDRQKMSDAINEIRAKTKKNEHPVIDQMFSFIGACNMLCVINLKENWITDPIYEFNKNTPNEIAVFFKNR